ncbi:Collagen alpha-4(VI) chain [Folsomia candida]|uniref:Collagen alpha-4(VI) chain n=1 Tax=Folsomia candida TaxID=158441 RepID=A0A226DUB4_FOLCA|nr:Collagen alpha-4(VI) chain [Folsomia candida]
MLRWLTNENGTIPIPCYETNDLYIVLDASGSISPADFVLAKEFIVKLISAFAVHDKNKIGMSTFSSSVNPVVSLNFVADWDTLKAQILGAAHSKGGTNTHLALDSAIAQTVPLRRTDIPQNVVVLTDGMSNNMPLTTEAAHTSVRIFRIGTSPIPHD